MDALKGARAKKAAGPKKGTQAFNVPTGHIEAIAALRTELMKQKQLDPMQLAGVARVYASLGLSRDVLAHPAGYTKQLEGMSLGRVMTALQGEIPDAAFAKNAKLSADLPGLKADTWSLTEAQNAAQLPFRLAAFAYIVAEHWNERAQATGMVSALASNASNSEGLGREGR